MPIPRTANSTSNEPTWILLWTVVGGVLRAWNPGRLGLDHFDEGIYDGLARWILSRPRGAPWFDPMGIAYAPPGFPALTAGVGFFLVDLEFSAHVVSWLAGTLAIPVAAWLSRGWIGPRAGAAAAALVALSGPHVTFSRMALTDATFLLAWLVALGVGARFLERPGATRALLLGAAVGVAQLVKYNGWLAGGVIALAAVIGLAHGETRDASRRALAWGLLAAVLAGLVYSPWYSFVERHGGYADLLRHHRSYVDGWAAWPRNWWLQQSQQIALSGRLSLAVGWPLLAWLGALAAAMGVGSGVAWREGLVETARSRGPVLALAAIASGLMADLPWWIGLVSLPGLFASRRAADRVLALWWLVLSLMTPLYHPYARLWLPLGGAGFLMSARLIVELVDAAPSAEPEGTIVRPRIRPPIRRLLVAVVVCSCARLSILYGASPMGDLLAPTDGLRRTVATEFGTDEWKGKTVLVYGRPRLLELLAEIGARPGRLPDLDGARARVEAGQCVIVDGAVAGAWSPEELGPGARFERTRELGVRVGPATRLDIDPAWAFRGERGGGRNPADEVPLWIIGRP